MENGAARSHLFFDDTGISTSGSVRRTWHAPVKYPGNPVMLPADGEREILLFGTVLRDGGRYRMWYFAHPEDNSVDNYWIGYAESGTGSSGDVRSSACTTALHIP